MEGKFKKIHTQVGVSHSPQCSNEFVSQFQIVSWPNIFPAPIFFPELVIGMDPEISNLSLPYILRSSSGAQFELLVSFFNFCKIINGVFDKLTIIIVFFEFTSLTSPTTIPEKHSLLKYCSAMNRPQYEILICQ